MAAIAEQVRDRMGLDHLEKKAETSLASIEDQINLQRLEELAIMGMKAVEDGDVQFEKMGEVIQALKALAYERRLIEGEPTERRETTVRLQVGGENIDPRVSIRAMLEIIADAGDQIEEGEVIDAEVVEPDTDSRPRLQEPRS